MLNFYRFTGFGIDPIFPSLQVLGLIRIDPVLPKHSKRHKNKKPHSERNRVFQKKGDDILSHITAVPSAQAGLTTLFGMGRGEPRRNNHLKRLQLLWAIILQLKISN